MARQRSPNRDNAKNEWLNCFGTITSKQLAQKYNVSESRIRKWKSEDKWKELLDKKKRKRGGQYGNKNAVGAGAPYRNDNAETHGAYSTIHLEDLPLEKQEFIKTITLDIRKNMLRELQILIAKEDDLKHKIRTLESESESELHIDRVVETLIPFNAGKAELYQDKLLQLKVEHDNLTWDIGDDQPTKQQSKKLDMLERQIAEITDKYDSANVVDDCFKTNMQTVMKSSPFERAMKLETELNKVHGRILKLLDSIKNYEIDKRRIELEERKHELAKQKLKGEFEIDPDSGEIIDDNSGEYEIEYEK